MYAELRSEVPLLTPGITIMSVGTEIRYGDTMAPDHGWEEELNQGWDREAVVEEGNKLNLKFQVLVTTPSNLSILAPIEVLCYGRWLRGKCVGCSRI